MCWQAWASEAREAGVCLWGHTRSRAKTRRPDILQQTLTPSLPPAQDMQHSSLMLPQHTNHTPHIHVNRQGMLRTYLACAVLWAPGGRGRC